ncbi:hypothetical protein ACG9YX_07315 [Acinetobacter nematophilus]|uniref:hypothetical protein n=1 Tax=Acinetobacter nematophilus TaxID=2994642 RepID=UPI003AF5D659
MIKIALSAIVLSLMFTSVAAKPVKLAATDATDCVSDELCAVAEQLTMATSEAGSSSNDAERIKPPHEKYDLDTGDEWKLIHQHADTQFFESITTISDGNQLIQAWVKSVNPKKQYTINYYQLLCKDRTFTRLEQFKSRDDQDYKRVKRVEHYRQTQSFDQAGELLPVLEKLCL